MSHLDLGFIVVILLLIGNEITSVKREVRKLAKALNGSNGADASAGMGGLDSLRKQIHDDLKYEIELLKLDLPHNL